MDQAEERQELRPCAVAVVHRVGVPTSVLAEPLEEAGDRVVLLVDLVVREEVAVLGVEDEHEPHQDGEQARVDVVRIVREHLAEQFAPALVVGRLEAADQLVECCEHLLGELGRDEVLVFAAIGQDGGEPLLVGEQEQPLEGEQHEERGEDRSARDLGHRLHGKRQVSGRLAPGCVDQPEARAVRQEADRYLRLA